MFSSKFIDSRSGAKRNAWYRGQPSANNGSSLDSGVVVQIMLGEPAMKRRPFDVEGCRGFQNTNTLCPPRWLSPTYSHDNSTQATPSSPFLCIALNT